MNADEINTILATRTADLLAKWAGLPLLAKLQIGDVSGDGMAYRAISGVVKNGDVNAPTHAALADDGGGAQVVDVEGAIGRVVGDGVHGGGLVSRGGCSDHAVAAVRVEAGCLAG